MPISKSYIAQNYRARFNIDPEHSFELEYKKCSPGGESDDDFYIFIEMNSAGELIAKYDVHSSYHYERHSSEHYYNKYSPDGQVVASGEFD